MNMILAFCGFLVILWLYFIPSIIGRDKKRSDGIQILNLFLGWTFIGWVIALIWAVSDEKDMRREVLK